MDQDSVFDWLLKGAIGLLAWLGVRLHKRVDDLEKEKVGHEDLHDLKNQMLTHMAETRKAFADQNIILLNIVGKLPRDRDHQ